MTDTPVERARRWHREGIPADEIRARLEADGLDQPSIAVVLANTLPEPAPKAMTWHRGRQVARLLAWLGAAAGLTSAVMLAGAMASGRGFLEALIGPFVLGPNLAALALVIVVAALDVERVRPNLISALVVGLVASLPVVIRVYTAIYQESIILDAGAEGGTILGVGYAALAAIPSTWALGVSALAVLSALRAPSPGGSR